MKLPLEKTWVRLTDAEREDVRKIMLMCGGKSKNGVAGWYYRQRKNMLESMTNKPPRKRVKKKPQIYTPDPRNMVLLDPDFDSDWFT